ncbi:MAG: PEP-CTERM sorting domain-containing protein [Terriglobales bacterium]
MVLLLGMSVAAAAQGSIVLQGGVGQPITFSGQGPGTDTVGVTLGACDNSGVCTLSGTGVGSGSAAITSSGNFIITSPPNYATLGPALCCTLADGIFAGNAPGLTGWPETTPPFDSSSSIGFVYTGSAHGQTGTLLTGSLDLLNFVQAPGSSQGSFNDFSFGGAVITSENVPPSLFLTCAGYPQPCPLLAYDAFNGVEGALQLSVQFPTDENVNALVGTDQQLAGSLAVSTLSPTPEPSSLILVLMGAGLLVLGGCTRFRGRVRIPL